MTNRIYPSVVLKPNTPLGYDGADYRCLQLDKASDGDPALRTAFPVDRAPSTLLKYIESQYGNHNLTDRLTYTVPSGKRAVITAALAYVQVPGTTGYGEVRIRLNGRAFFWQQVENTYPLRDTVRQSSYYIWLNAGDIVTIQTGNTSSSTLWFLATCVITEFDA
jgi:hypothetical protein